MAESFLLDSSALLTTLFDEPGAAAVDASLARAAISAVNYSEVIAKLIKRGERSAAAVQTLDDPELPVIPWDATLARGASALSILAWTHGLSLGDRACLGAARRLRRTVLTAEREWRRLPNLGIAIRIVR